MLEQVINFLKTLGFIFNETMIRWKCLLENEKQKNPKKTNKLTKTVTYNYHILLIGGFSTYIIAQVWCLIFSI